MIKELKLVRTLLVIAISGLIVSYFVSSVFVDAQVLSKSIFQGSQIIGFIADLILAIILWKSKGYLGAFLVIILGPLTIYLFPLWKTQHLLKQRNEG